MSKIRKGSLENIGRLYVEGKNFEEVKEISDVLNNIEFGDINIEWGKKYPREIFDSLRVIAFKERERNIGIRPINITIEEVHLNPKEKCNKKHGINYVKTQEDNAWTEFKIPALNYKLILYYTAIREHNKHSDF